MLIHFLRSAIEAQSEEHINTLKTELDFIRYEPVMRRSTIPLTALSYSSVIGGIGDSLPHACAFVQNVFVLRKIGY